MTPAPANRMLATLGVVSEIILRAKNNTELFEGVAVATAHGGNFLGTAILMRGADGSTHLAASAGIGIPGLDARQPAGPGGVIGATLRSGEPSIAHDCWADELLAPWHEEYKELGVRAAAAIPILCRGSTAGVLVVFASAPTALTWRNILALTRIADNVAFGLDTFDRSSQTAALTRMLSALTETDEAIMRSATQDELFRLVCEATIKGARFSSGSVMLVEPGNPTCKLAASAGIAADYVRSLTLSIDPTIPEGQGLTGTAYRTRRPAIANDFQRDPRTAHWHGRAIETTRSGGAFPLTDDERVIDDKAVRRLTDSAADVLEAGIGALEGLAEDQWTAARLEEVLRAAIVEGRGMPGGEGIKPRLAFGPLRVAVTGRQVSPPLFESMEILGAPASLARLRALRDRLG